MSVNATMGLKNIYIAPVETSGTMPADGASWVDLGDVYKESCKLSDDDPEETVHESETSKKKITIFGEYASKVELSLMDPDLEMLARLFGGSITGAAGKRVWLRPRKPTNKEWAVKLMPEEGLMVSCASATIKPKFEITYSSKGICLVPMTIKLQDQLQLEEGAKAPTATPTV